MFPLKALCSTHSSGYKALSTKVDAKHNSDSDYAAIVDLVVSHKKKQTDAVDHAQTVIKRSERRAKDMAKTDAAASLRS